MTAPYLASSLPDEQLAEFHRLMNEEIREVAVFFMDTDGVIKTWNRAAEDMKGYGAQDAIGQHLRLLYTEEDRARGWAEHNLRKAREDGFYREETWRRKKDGSVFWARIALTALFDRPGRHVGFSKVTVDLTSHKMLERCVAERNETRRVLKAANAGLWTWRPAEACVEVCPNFLQLLGHPKVGERMTLAQWLDFVHPDDRSPFAERFRQASAAEPDAPFKAEVRMCPKDGAARWFYAHADWQPREPSGDPASEAPADPAAQVLGGVLIDIDELKTTSLKLRQAIDELKMEDARKDEFLAMLAHELRNPLAPIRAAAEVLRIAQPDASRVKNTSDVIARQVDHMTGLIDDLLDVSRVNRGLVELDKRKVDFGHVLHSAVEQVNPVIRAHRHRLALDLSPEVAIIEGDEKRLVQMLSNLLHNAAKFTPDGGHIALTTDIQSGSIVVRVEDNGIGMPPKLVEQVFDLFVQAERTPDRSTGGLGLGLALVRSLAERHGGTVGCESAGPGQGSTFTVRLPLAAEDAAPRSLEPSGTPPHHAARLESAPRLLVVDDNVDAAEMLAMVLEQKGYRVAVEFSARRALERARQERPDVCLLDIGLPEIDGNELARQLRAQPETERAVLIAITGYGRESDRRATTAAGFRHHLTKPVDVARLDALLKSL